MVENAVERLYLRLTESLQRRRRDAFGAPVTVAEIYQELVPYRLVRAELGFDMNADYEHALLRLLAGEGGHARLEPSSARDAIVRELTSRNPNVSIYREYAGCDVWITPARNAVVVAGDPLDAVRDVLDDEDDDVVGKPAQQLEWSPLELLQDDVAVKKADSNLSFALSEAESEPPPAGTARPARPAAAAAATPSAAPEPKQAKRAGRDVPPPKGQAKEPTKEPPKAQAKTPSKELPKEPASAAARPEPKTEPRTPAQPTPPRARASQPAAVEAPANRCGFCDSALPANRTVRFCPFCGHDLATRPCPACAEPIEAGWSFCVACGASAEPV